MKLPKSSSLEAILRTADHGETQWYRCRKCGLCCTGIEILVPSECPKCGKVQPPIPLPPSTEWRDLQPELTIRHYLRDDNKKRIPGAYADVPRSYSLAWTLKYEDGLPYRTNVAVAVILSQMLTTEYGIPVGFAEETVKRMIRTMREKFRVVLPAALAQWEKTHPEEMDEGGAIYPASIVTVLSTDDLEPDLAREDPETGERTRPKYHKSPQRIETSTEYRTVKGKRVPFEVPGLEQTYDRPDMSREGHPWDEEK